MPGLYIASTTPRAGKSLLAFSLGLLLQHSGHSVGYMKPVGAVPQKIDDSIGDVDALIVQEVLGQQMPPEILTQVFLPTTPRALPLYDESARSTVLERIAKAYAQIASGKDVVLVSGTGAFPATGRVCCASGLDVVRALGLRTLLVEPFEQGYSCDALLQVKDSLGDSLVGVVLNNVPVEDMRDATEVLAPYLASRGIAVYGVIPREPGLCSIRVADLAYGLKGHILAGNASTATLVEGFFIGTMQVENFMIHLQRNTGKAIIVGGDRADLQLAALYNNCPCLILTGNLFPGELVRLRAEKAGIPLVSVQEDTYAAARAVARIFKEKKIHELSQIRLGRDLVSDSVVLPALFSSVFGVAETYRH